MKKLAMVMLVILPRVFVIGVWVGTNFFQQAFDSWVFPVVGIILAPFSVLTWAFIVNQQGGVAGIWWGVLAVTVIVDIVAGRVGGNRQLFSRYGRT